MDSTTLIKIQDMFNEKKWEKDSEMYDRFVKCMERLDDDEQNFILELTSKYTYITLDAYENLIKNMFRKAYAKGILKNKIYIIPLLKYSGDYESEMKQVKSSNLVAYLTKSTFLQYEDWMRGKDLNVYNFLTDSDISLINQKECLVIFVDDYIGSGNTAIGCIEEYARRGLKLENSVIMSICIENNAKKRFTEAEMAYIFSDVEYYNFENVFGDSIEESLKMVKKIAGKIKTSKEYIYGYEKTGALISLVRTPNNTLPFYWSTKRGRKAPFPR